MKKRKYILYSAVIFSFFFITACSTTQSVPSDDVYYSTTPHDQVAVNAHAAKASPATVSKKEDSQGNNAVYQEGKVENISSGTSGQTTTASNGDYDVDYSARLKRFHDSGDTTLDYYDDYYEGRTMPGESNKNSSGNSSSASLNFSTGLGFGNPYFGSSWSFGFGYPYSGWGFGFGYGWGYPYFGGYYPPYYGYYPPSYGYYPPYLGYPPYYGYYPPYYGYYPPYYPGYPDVGYSNPVYRPRIARGGGSSVPHSVVAGGSGINASPNGKSSARGTASGTMVSGKRVPVKPTDRNGKMIKADGPVKRPAGSMRYNAALAKEHAREIHGHGKLNRPDGYVSGGGGTVNRSYEGTRSPRFGVYESRNRGAESYNKPPAFRREEAMPKPRFEKPKQYRSLESSSPRSSKEFYRTVRPSGSGYRNTSVSTVRSRPQPARVQHIYRPSGTSHSVYRGNRPHNVKVYSAPTRSFSPNTFHTPVRRNSSGTTPTRNFSAPTRTFSAPVRVNTGSSGGGTVRRSTGSGGIKH